MTETLILKINRPEDKSLILQLAERLGIAFEQKKTRAKATAQLKPKRLKNKQLLTFEKMERLRLRMQLLPPRPEIDIAQIANEVNAL